MNPLVIVGCGKCVWDDLKWIRTWGQEGHDFGAMLVNDMIIHFREFPGVKVGHVVCYDIGRVEHYAAIRRSMCPHESFISHSQADPSKPDNKADRIWNLETSFQLSGPFAVAVAVAMGYDRIILAGVPEDNSGHYWNVNGFRDETGYDNKCTHEHWMSIPKNKVRSLSGWTREHFHFPTIAWLDGREVG